MKSLKKLLLINWYNIEHKVIEFEQINFLTGDNGAGKSTIIDAIQFLMLGNPKGNYFNKAANDRADRDLKSYLRCEIGDDGETGFTYKRNGYFSSYIVMEYFDNATKKPFSIGVVFDVVENNINHKFFHIDSSIPENDFIINNTPLTISELKIFLNSKYANKNWKFFDSDSEYQQATLSKLGGLNKRFFDLFKQAVSFKPIEKIDNFIVNFICNIKDNVNVVEMQDNIRSYTELEKQADIIDNKINYLEEINNTYAELTTAKEKSKIYEFLVDYSKKEECGKEINLIQSTIDSNKKEIESINKQNDELQKSKEDLSNKENKLRQEKAENSVAKLENQYKEEIKNYETSIKNIDDDTNTLNNTLNRKVIYWQNIIDTSKSVISELANISILNDNLYYLKHNGILNSDEQVLMDVSKTIKEIANKALELSINIKSEKKQITNDLDIIKSEIKKLESGQKIRSNKLDDFKQEIETRLSHTFNKSVKLQIFADLIEIKDSMWRNAIEGYLNTQREYLIVDPFYYKEASKIYKEMSRNNKQYHSFGIVDCEKIRSKNISPMPNSLAEEIETDNELARIYADYVLGSVIKCEKIEDLRNYNTSITKECMMYKSYVLRKINPAIYEFPLIGKNSIIKQKELKEAEKARLEAELVEITDKIKIYTTISTIADESISTEFIDNATKCKSDNKEKERIIVALNEVKEKYNKLDLTVFQEITKELEIVTSRIKKLEEDLRKNDKHIAKLESDIEHDEKDLSQKNAIYEELNKTCQEKYDVEYVKNVGIPRYEVEVKKNLTKKVFEIYQSNLAKSTYEINDIKERLREKRSIYNNEFKMSLPVENFVDNMAYEEEYNKLNNIELPTYKDKIKEAKNKAYEQFQEDFLAKIRSNIEEAKRKIKELNEALKSHQFGNDSYYYTVEPRKDKMNFYDMIMDPMLMEGYNIATLDFTSKYQNEIKELFDKISIGSKYGEITPEYESSLKEYTDYRNYLVFDLIVSSNGNKQRLSKTLLKKSGGETQTPFYISVLASFAQLYQMNSGRSSNTINLVVFDEAFSKMDKVRIEESIGFLKKLGFQAIFSAPSEKVGEISKLVSSTLVVLKRPDGYTDVLPFSKVEEL